DLFSSPAPAPPYFDPAPTGSATFASTFNGADPNGSWQLFVVDDLFNLIGTPGNIQGGWALTLDVVFNTSITLTSGVNPGFAGDLINFQVNVTSSGPIPAGTVTFKNGPTILGTEPLIEGNTAIDFAFVPGVHNITATYNGGANFHPSTSDPVVQTVIPAPTTVNVVSSLNPSTFGQPVTFTATVAKLSFSIFSPTGTVTFLDGGAVLGTGLLNANGVATLTTAATSGGSRSITAVYEGDSNFAPGTSAELAQTVNAAATTTTLLSSSNPSAFGAAVTLTATVSGGALGIPAGTVTFKDGPTTLDTGTLNESGVGTFSTSDLSVGTHSITAIYDGSGDFAASTSAAVSQTVDKGTPTMSLISFLNPADLGQEITFRADVTSAASTSPTGTVFFKDGLTPIGTQALDDGGTALFSTSTLTAGFHNITVTYDGDANFNGEISSVLVQEVIGLESATALTSSPNPAIFGQIIVFTATVTSLSAPGTPTEGTVTFKDGEVVLGTTGVNAAGVASLGRQLQSGEHSITATYNGGPVFRGSASATLTQTVNTSTARFLGGVFPTKLFFRFREPVGFEVTVVSDTGGQVTGIVTLFEGDTALGTATLDAAGRATVLVNGLRVGEHRIRAVYNGDSNFPAGAESQVFVYSESPRPR
ncbi:MAG: Ig-like domain-containing protein, partial [Acidobacteriales bacterium]|nr:Ig-like domain-containing protein [Terriglobales bacterium]